MTYPNDPREPQYPTGAPPVSPPPQYNDHPVHQAFNQQFALPQRPRNGAGLASLITAGVAGILVLVAAGGNIFNGATGESLAGALVAVAAVIVGLVGVVKADKSGASKAMAAWGIVVGLVFVVIGFALVGYYAHQADQINQCLSDLIACGQSQ